MTGPMGGEWTSVDLRQLSRTGVVHFMGISGAGMSTLAEYLARDGGMVTGCDLRPGQRGALEERGVGILQGHDAAHVADAVALVMTSAIPATHPEVAAARSAAFPCSSGRRPSAPW
jgi:UDP-N-acetylmuramate--alanine ligase